MRPLRLAPLALLLALVTATLWAQDRPAADEKKAAADEKKGGSLVIVNARVHGHDGPVSVLVTGGKVRAVGADVRAPRGLTRVDAGGLRVAPGRVDAWAAVLGADPFGRGADAFDRHDAHAIGEALQQGVTAVFLS